MLKRIYYAIAFGLLLLCSCDRTEPEFPEGGRTVLIYMAADNSLDRYSVTNIDHIVEGLKDKEECRVVIYVDRRYDVPHLLEIQGGANPVIDTVKVYAEENSASPETLRRVLGEMRERYPSESYGLILWSHGMGWLPENYNFPSGQMMRKEWDLGIPTKWFGQDMNRGGSSETNEYMEIGQLAEALAGHFDFILFDACFMSSVEVLYELRDKADYFIVSPAEIVADGFPYKQIMPYLFGGEADFRQVCREYFEYYNRLSSSNYANSATVSLVKAEELDALAEIAREIAGECKGNLTVWRYPLSTSSLPDVFYDLGEYIKAIGTEEQQKQFQYQLEKTVVFKQATSQFFGKPLPIEQFSGLSVYIPQSRWQSMNEVYSHLSWYQTVYKH